MRINPVLRSTKEQTLEVYVRDGLTATYCCSKGYAASQWLSSWLQMLGVTMVTGVAFIAVLERHLNSVDPGVREEVVCFVD